MPTMRYFSCFFIIFLLIATGASAQSMKGRVQDVQQAGIPYATIYIKELKQGIATNENGDFDVRLSPGSYTLVIQSLGYEVQHINAQVPQAAPLTVTLPEKAYELRSIALSANGEDPAYIIMRKAIGMAPYYRNVVSAYTADVYLKTNIKLEHIKGIAALGLKMEGLDPKKLSGAAIVQESVNEIIFTAPDQYRQKMKSVINASSIDLSGFGLNENDLNAGMARFNIYGTSPSLPLAPVAFSNYKFVYEGDNMVDGKLVNKIKVTPRRKSNDLLSGYLYIVDKTWNVYNAELLQETSFGTMLIQQNYGEVEPGILLPVSYNMEAKIDVFGVKGGGTMAGSIKYQSVETNKRLLRQPSGTTTATADTVVKVKNPKREKLQQEAAKIAGKEQVNNSDMRKLARLEQQLAEISQEEQLAAEGKEKSLEITNHRYVMEKDSNMVRNDTALFKSLRPVPLVADELVTYQKYDSIIKVNPRDSTGKALRQNENDQDWFFMLMSPSTHTLKNELSIGFNGLLGPRSIDFNTVDGYIYGLSGGLYKHYANTGRRWWLNAGIQWAFSRQVPLWKVSFQHLYHPGRRAFWEIEGGQSSSDFAGDNGVGSVNSSSSLLFRVNYAHFYHNNYIRLSHRTDLVNGLELFTALQWSDRRELQNICDYSFFYKDSRDYRPNIPRNADVMENLALLSDNRAAVFDATINYTPEYYYRKRGERKIMAYSHYPTFSLWWRKGIPGVFNSASNFDFLRFRIAQTVRYGYYNNFSYSASSGKFFNTNTLSFADYVHFYGNEAGVSFDHGAEPYQLLPQYTFSTNAWYVSAHAHYHSPLLALKYIPFLTNMLFDENLYAAYLLQPNLRHYVEAGYGISLMQSISVGVHVGFYEKGYYGWGIRLSMDVEEIME